MVSSNFMFQLATLLFHIGYLNVPHEYINKFFQIEKKKKQKQKKRCLPNKLRWQGHT